MKICVTKGEYLGILEHAYLGILGGKFSTNVTTKTIPLLSSLNQAGSDKQDNYLNWYSLVLPILKGHRLNGYVLGTKVSPPEFFLEADGVRVNPAFEEWLSNDQLIFGW